MAGLTLYLTQARTLRWYLRGMNRCVEGRPEPLPADWFATGMGNPAYDVPPYERAVAEIEGFRYMAKLYRLADEGRLKRKAVA